MKAVLYIFISIILFSSCDDSKISVEIPENNFEGLWLVTSVVGPRKNDPALPHMDKFNKGRWIQFENDSSYTTNIKGQYDFGKYRPLGDGKDSVEFMSFRGDVYHIAAKYNPNGSGVILNRINVPEMTDTYDYYFNCTVRNFKYRNSAYNTYAVENNYWRLPAESSENDSLIARRMANHIDFWLAYLNMADKMNVRSFDYSNINTCFLFSPYGVSLLNFRKWESTFQTLFYTKEEAERAYKLTSKAIYKSEFRKNENAYLQGIDLFRQIRYHLLNPESE